MLLYQLPSCVNKLLNLLSDSYPSFTPCSHITIPYSVRSNSTNKMALLLHFVNRRWHTDKKVLRMTLSCDQS